MSLEQAYNEWSEQYDSNNNKTRDLEAVALRATLQEIAFKSCLEIGCGTGKNTVWLSSRAQRITAVDLSEKMLSKAREKNSSGNVSFVQADIRQPWKFLSSNYELVTFSLVLEHVADLGHVLGEASEALVPGGYLYIGELHPFKQYLGSKEHFEKDGITQYVEAYTHHVSDYIQAAKENGLILEDLKEFFDPDNSVTPRILACLFTKVE